MVILTTLNKSKKLGFITRLNRDYSIYIFDIVDDVKITDSWLFNVFYIGKIFKTVEDIYAKDKIIRFDVINNKRG